MTGSSVGPDSYDDYATIKYNSAGQEQWVARYDGPGHFVDYGAAIAVDASDNVYVTGSSLGSGTNLDYATIKYVQEFATPTPTPTPTAWPAITPRPLPTYPPRPTRPPR